MSSRLAKDSRTGGWVYGDDQGHPYATGASKAGVSVQSASFTAGAASEAKTFAELGLANMKNVTYQVFVGGTLNVLSTPSCAARSITGITIDGLTAADIVDVLIVGAMDTQVTE